MLLTVRARRPMRAGVGRNAAAERLRGWVSAVIAFIGNQWGESVGAITLDPEGFNVYDRIALRVYGHIES